MPSEHFSAEELMCHGASQGHCGCGPETANNVSPLLLEKLEALRAMIGGPIEISCAYRCPAHNAEVGGVPNSQHVDGTAADVQTPNYDNCNTPLTHPFLPYCIHRNILILLFHELPRHLQIYQMFLNGIFYYQHIILPSIYILFCYNKHLYVPIYCVLMF